MKLNRLSHFLSLMLAVVLITSLMLAQDKKPTDPPMVPQKKDDEKLKLRTDLVSLIVSVTDSYNRSVIGLAQEHYEIYEDKVKQKIEHFTAKDEPVSLGIVFDVSGSMKEKIAKAKLSLQKFLDNTHDDDDMFLVAFNDRARLVQDFTTSPEAILGKLMFTETEGSTALYDACYIGVEKLQQGRHAKKVMLIISDGQDNNSRYTYSELRNQIKEADVIIYAIGIISPEEELVGFGKSLLEELARVTGGRAFFPFFFDDPINIAKKNSPELDEILIRIALEIRHQYSIGYYPTNQKHDGSWRKVQVKIKPPKGLGRLYLKYKEKYKAPTS